MEKKSPTHVTRASEVDSKSGRLPTLLLFLIASGPVGGAIGSQLARTQGSRLRRFRSVHVHFSHFYTR